MRPEHRQTLGMPDILDEYPVPGPRTLDGVLGFELLSVGESEATGRAVYAARHRGRTTWVWEVEMLDDDDRCCAISRVTVAVRQRRD